MKANCSHLILLLSSCIKFDRIIAFSYRRNIHRFHTDSTLSILQFKTSPCTEHAFCAEASIDAAINTHQNDVSPVAHTRQLDQIISAREWMENIEAREGSYGVGAYTVIRCDVSVSYVAAFANETDDGSWEGNIDDIDWKIWGLNFHMDRLFTSYNMLLKSQDEFEAMDFNSLSFERSKQETEEVISSLLRDASTSCHEPVSDAINTAKNNTSHDQLDDIKLYRTLMLTILWTPPRHQPKNALTLQPIVRGHASFAGPSRSSIDDHMSPAISTCLAVPVELTSNALEELPHRYSQITDQTPSSIGATAKISSWCRKRRPLEDPERFKVPGMNIREVLLVNQYENTTSAFLESIEILEGLTSNLFVIYKDGTLRTAPTPKVLPGYSRHLAIQALQKMKSHGGRQLILDERAPTVKDALDGLWSEVFVTSAIRLLVPVNNVLIPTVRTADNQTPNLITAIWQGDRVDQSQHLRSAMLQIGLEESSMYIAENIK